MKQAGLPGAGCPTPTLNGNRGAIGWIESGCRPSKKLRHENLAELGIAEAKQHNEVSFYWIPGKTNPADIFTKEDNDVQHYCSLRDLMVMAREEFTSDNTEHKSDTPEEADDIPSDTLTELLDEEDSKTSDKIIQQSCVRWADIVKKGRCKRPAPPAMGGAKRRA